MEKWKIARYFIEAKKSVDSIIYISKHLSEVQGIDVQKKVKGCLRDFYINCRTVFDNSYPVKGKKDDRETLKKTDEVLKAILYEVDKNHAHKDENYKAKRYNSLEEHIQVLKEQLQHLKKLCSSSLPEVITIDFVPHDRELYRLINRIDAMEEERIKKSMHPLYGNTDGEPIGEPLTVYHDTEDEIENDSSKYAVIIDAGLNEYEGLQNRQDGCIKINLLYGFNSWCQFNPLINPNYRK